MPALRPTCAAGLVLAALLPGCVRHHRLYVTGASLHREVTALRTHGEARVAVRDDSDADAVSSDVIRVDQTIGGREEPHLVRDLIQGDTLRQVWDFPFLVREYDTTTAMPVVKGTIGGLVFGSFVGAVACGIGCADTTRWKTAAEVTMLVDGVVIVGTIVYVLVSCVAGRSCRD